MTHHLLLAAGGKVLVAVHQVLDYAHHLNDEFPLLVLDLAGFLHLGRVLVKALYAVLLRPLESLLELGFVVNALGHSSDYLHLIDRLDSHAEVLLDELGADYGTADTHGNGAYLEVALAAHGSRRYGTASEAEQLFRNVVGDRGIVSLLNVVTVDAECGQTLLSVGSEHRREVNSAGSLGAVEAPYALDGHGIHIHSLRAVAPAGGDGKGDVNAAFLELIRTGCRLGNSADSGVGDDHLHRLTVGVADILLKQLRRRPCHIHGLLLEGLANLQISASAVDGGAYTYDGIIAYKSVFCHNSKPPYYLVLSPLSGKMKNFPQIYIIYYTINAQFCQYVLLFLINVIK